MTKNSNNLVLGQLIDAPGAPRGYTYGAFLVCPKCRHKSMIYRPRRSVWVCYYKDSNGSKCDLEMRVYSPPARLYGSVEKKDDFYDKLEIEVCGDLIKDILGEDMASNHSQEICGGSLNDGSRRSGKSSLSAYNNEKIKKYRQKLMAV